MNDEQDALLSRLLFESRERSEMFADVVEARTGQRDEWGRRLVAEIDAYRAARGWSPHGYGGEGFIDGTDLIDGLTAEADAGYWWCPECRGMLGRGEWANGHEEDTGHVMEWRTDDPLGQPHGQGTP